MATSANIARDVNMNQYSLQQLQSKAIVMWDLYSGEVLCVNREVAAVAVIQTIAQNDIIRVLLKLLDKDSNCRTKYTDMLAKNLQFIKAVLDFWNK